MLSGDSISKILLFNLYKIGDKLQSDLKNGASIALAIASCRFEGGVFLSKMALMKHTVEYIVDMCIIYYVYYAHFYMHI